MCSILDPLQDGSLLLEPDVLSGPQVRTLRLMLRPDLLSAKRLIVDLSRVPFIDSAGCSVLLWAHMELKKREAHLIVCNVAPAVRSLFELLRLSSVLNIAVSREQAFAFADL